MRPQREGPRKKIPLAHLKNLLIEQLIHETAAENIRREIPIPVSAVQRLAPETSFMETVKKMTETVASAVSQDKEKEQQMSVQSALGSLIFVEKIISRSGTQG